MNNNMITLRFADPSDATELLRIYSPYILQTAITFECAVPDVNTFAGRIAATMQKYPYLVAEADGTIIGYAYAGPFVGRAACDWSVETSVYVDRSCRRLGVGGLLYRTLEEILRMQNIRNLNAAIACSKSEQDEYVSDDSVKFHLHMGYSTVGRFDRCAYKFGRWYDLLWMEKHIGKHDDDPERVLLIDEVREDAARQLGIIIE